MPTCIYCRATDPPGGFTTEHVLLAAFGGFRDAPTLTDAVCGECNQYFGDHLDRLLARDSAEALLRLYYGLKEPSALPKMLKDRVTVRMPNDGSRWGGVLLRFAAPPEGQAGPVVVDLVVPQVGCERRDGRWDYFTEDELPPWAELALRFETTYTGRAAVLADSEADEQRLTAVLKAATGGRFKQTEQLTGFPPFAHASVRTEVTWRFDALLARAVAKITLNYLAYTAGAAFALHPDFDAVRRFVRYDEGKPPDFLQFRGAPTFRGAGGPVPHKRGHLLAVSWDVNGRRLLGLLSPFVEQITYVVRLTDDFTGVWRQVGAGHFYDLTDMRAHPMGYAP